MGCCPKDHLACVHLFQVNLIIVDPTLIYLIDFKNRFHSAVLLIDCWKGSYIPEDEEPRSIELVQNCYVNPI